MASMTKCDGCQRESAPGQQWLRVRIEPFYTTGSGNRGEECVAYNEGMHVEACGPQCAALALSIQAGVLSGSYQNMSEAMLRTSKKLAEG
mgnify:CR=1 FL=1